MDSEQPLTSDIAANSLQAAARWTVLAHMIVKESTTVQFYPHHIVMLKTTLKGLPYGGARGGAKEYSFRAWNTPIKERSCLTFEMVRHQIVDGPLKRNINSTLQLARKLGGLGAETI